jgi:2-aminoethylphosphonate dioxygenase
MNHHRLDVTKVQIDSFRQNGYAHLPHFFSPETVHCLRNISDEMSLESFSILKSSLLTGESLSHRAKTYPLELIVVPEADNPRQVCRYEFMVGSSFTFKSFVASYIEPTIAKLVGRTVVPFKDKTNEKLPGAGAFRPHQDFTAYQFFKPRYYVTALLSIDPATLVNGCVQFAINLAELVAKKPSVVAEIIEGKPLLHYKNGGLNHGDIRPDIEADLHWQPFQSSPFDLVVFDSFVPHYSEVNRSAESRRAVFVTFNLASEGLLYGEYYADKRVNYDDPKFHVSTPTSHAASREHQRMPK